MWNLRKFLTSAAQWQSTGSNISWTCSIIYQHKWNRFKFIISKKMLSNAIEVKICEKNRIWTVSNMSHLKFTKQHNRDKNMWWKKHNLNRLKHTTSKHCKAMESRWKHVNKFCTENINVNLKDVENVKKLFLIQKNKKKPPFKWAFYSSEVLNSALHKKQ